ncbi:hypothetical protein B0T22DRAFT_375860 [Podospora appendiculata]|uniref:Enoyl reductase (ER) domain-containing protein n=1 Tax=Podospora appendiculata TaxID=314037 RepID=A0AAE0XAI7_9PEZI|nr:hypothetical protein B0T22DRAFT_375860 [Podospora appendiculata]
MKAWQYTTATGGLEKNLKLTTLPLPTLSPVHSAAEVLIQVLSAALNPADYKLPELGLVSHAIIRTPAVPGMDFCGRVVKATSTVDSLRIGELVFGRIDASQHGTLAEYIAAPARMCTPLPTGVDPDIGATLGVAGLTAYKVIAPHVKPGDKVFINGGSGGTGTFGIQIAKALGCQVTVSCSTGKVALCRSLGADEVIDYTTTDVEQALKEGGLAFALCVDNVGSPAGLYKAADAFLLPGAKFVQVGVAMGWASAKTLVSRWITPAVLGGGKRPYELFSLRGQMQAEQEQLAKWVAEGKVKPVVEQVFAFGEAPQAFEKLKGGRCAGKVVVRVVKREA